MSILLLTALVLAQASEPIIVMPLSSLGSTDEAKSAIENVLLAEARNLRGRSIQTLKDIQVSNSQMKKSLLDCEGVATCLLEVVGGMGHDKLLVGSIAGFGSERVIDLTLFSARTGAAVAQSSEPATGSETELIWHIRKAVVQLLAPERYVGHLEISAPQPSVQIFIDGELVATTPLKDPVVKVSAGRHAIEAKGDGLVPFSKMVEVAYDEKVSIAIALPKNELFVGGNTPFRKRWWTWALAGAGAAGLGLGGYFNVLQARNSSDIESLAASGSLNASHERLFQDERSNWNRSVVFYGSGGALLLTAGTLMIVDLIQDR